MTAAKAQLQKTAEALISEGWAVLNTQRTITHYGGMEVANPPTFVDPTAAAKWRAGCKNLLRMLGPYGAPWQNSFDDMKDYVGPAKQMYGTLQGIKDAIANDLLISVESLVMAEAFSDLLEQAEYLLAEGYHLAAGVLGRAVLEEHLRKWCDKENCAPSKPRPTLNDYTSELYKAKHLDKIEMKHVEAMTAVGNEAAHNVATLTKDSVERLVRDLRDFLMRHRLA